MNAPAVVPSPDAEPIVPVRDNLTTPTIAGPYAAFPPDGARRRARTVGRRSMPEHGGRLDVADLELALLADV